MKAMKPMNQSGRYGKSGGMAIRSEISQARAALNPQNRELEKYKKEELRKLGSTGARPPVTKAPSSFNRPRAANFGALAPPKANIFRGGGGLKLPSITAGGGPAPLPSIRRFGHGNALPDSTANIWQQSSNNLLHNPALRQPSPIGVGKKKEVLGAAPAKSVASSNSSSSAKKKKKRAKKRKKAEKKAAKSIQKFVKRKMAPTLAAVRIQRLVRGHLCRRYVDMVKSAQQAGVMVAIRGTSQGRSGWYQDFDGTVYFFAVDAEGTWWQVVDQAEWTERREDLEGIAVLVCQKGTKKGGKDGKFKEYGHPQAKRGVKTWMQSDSGHWQRKKGLFG